MKDVTVALELTVDDDMPDKAIKIFVELFLKLELIGKNKVGTYNVESHMVEVVAIQDGTLYPIVDVNDWRSLK